VRALPRLPGALCCKRYKPCVAREDDVGEGAP
jgi:hypothetical protein